MSSNCENFIRAAVQQNWLTAFLHLNSLNMPEMVKGLAALDPDDFSELMQNGATAAAQINMPRVEYAAEVVRTRKLPKTPPADVKRTGQDLEAKAFLTRPTPLVFDNDLTGRLPATVAAPPRLTDADFQTAATNLSVDEAAVRAVAAVESGGRVGFGADNRPTLRYELHIFHGRTRGHYHKTHPHLSQPTLQAGAPFHVGGQPNEYSLLFGAMILRNRADTAWESASWGMFQVMGFNHSGFADVGAFVAAMFESEGRHLETFLAYVRAANLAPAMRRHDWATFAQGYNGSAYRTNHYDTQLANAFARFSRPAPPRP